jgi:hypothetical protein
VIRLAHWLRHPVILSGRQVAPVRSG